MIHLHAPELLLLSVPLAYGFARWGGFRPAWLWLVPIAGWIALQTYGTGLLPWWSHLWLAAPLFLFLRPWLKQTGVTGAIRFALVSLLLFGLTGPTWDLGGEGIDVVIVADRSRSMPDGSHQNILELIENVESNRGLGDRVAVVTFGSTAQNRTQPV